MPDTDSPSPGFPVMTVLATVATLFVFVGLVLLAYRSPNYLGDTKVEPKADPAAKLTEVRAKNQAVLDGTDPTVKMSVGKATAELVTAAEAAGKLPFPVEPLPPPKAPEKK